MPIFQQEYQGKNIEEAIAHACADLQTSQDTLNIEVISAGSAGIFGLCKKKAVILVSRKANSQSVVEQEGSPKNSLPPAPARHHTKPGRDRVFPKATPRREQVSTKTEEALEAKPPSPEIQNEIIALIENLLRLIGFTAEVSLSVKGSKVIAHIVTGTSADEIIGRDGSTLDALQYLLRKVITQKFTDKIVLDIDAGNYREDRQKELEELAREMAAKVKETGKSQIISALNPAERRIVHVTLQDDTDIRSSSIGEGLFKKVRIYLPGQGRSKSGSRSRGDSANRGKQSPRRERGKSLVPEESSPC